MPRGLGLVSCMTIDWSSKQQIDMNYFEFKGRLKGKNFNDTHRQRNKSYFETWTAWSQERNSKSTVLTCRRVVLRYHENHGTRNVLMLPIDPISRSKSTPFRTPNTVVVASQTRLDTPQSDLCRVHVVSILLSVIVFLVKTRTKQFNSRLAPMGRPVAPCQFSFYHVQFYKGNTVALFSERRKHSIYFGTMSIYFGTDSIYTGSLDPGMCGNRFSSLKPV